MTITSCGMLVRACWKVLKCSCTTMEKEMDVFAIELIMVVDFTGAYFEHPTSKNLPTVPIVHIPYVTIAALPD